MVPAEMYTWRQPKRASGGHAAFVVAIAFEVCSADGRETGMRRVFAVSCFTIYTTFQGRRGQKYWSILHKSTQACKTKAAKLKMGICAIHCLNERFLLGFGDWIGKKNQPAFLCVFLYLPERHLWLKMWLLLMFICHDRCVCLCIAATD